MDSLAIIIVISHVAAILALYNGFITCILQARLVTNAMESITRQPEVAGQITTTMFIGLAMCETGGIYGLLISIIILFANPLIPIYLQYLQSVR